MLKNLMILCSTTFTILFLFASSAYCGDYTLKRNVILEVTPNELIDLPGTGMKAGSFSIDFIDNEGREERTGKVGILKKDGTLLYVQAGKELGSWTDANGDCHYGIYKQYLTVDCFAYGAAHSRWLFLFRLGKDQIELLDVISKPYFDRSSSFDFMSQSYAKLKIKSSKQEKNRTYIEDIDDDGNPELIIEYVPEYFYEPGPVPFIKIYLEIKNDHIWPDFNPELYKPLFDQIKDKKKKEDPYFFHGYYSGTLTKTEIEAVLKKIGNKKYGKKILSMLTDTRTWYDGFHQHIDFKEVTLKTYKIKRSKK